MEFNPDFILHNLVRKFIDDIAACIEKFGFKRSADEVKMADISSRQCSIHTDGEKYISGSMIMGRF